MATLALGYCRVSTAGQVEHGASLDAQEATLRAEAERRGWDIEIVREEGRSAKSMNRPELQEALRRLDKGDAQILLSVRLDRVSRSVADFAEMMKRSQRRGWGLTFTATAIDTTDASGKFAAHIMIAAAEFERDLISARTREGMAQRKSEGVVFGRVVAPEFLPTYSKVLAMHADGMSYNTIAQHFREIQEPTARGGQWAAATVRRIVLSETAKGLAA
ncbi:MAG: recombinase family protein [Pseudolysinimonas sp.]